MNSTAQRVAIFFSKGCSFELVGGCLDAVREFSIEPIWYHGIPPPIPPATNSVVLEALADLESATTIIVVGTTSPVTPDWLNRPVARRVEQGARFFEYLFLTADQQTEASVQGESHPSTAASVRDLQDLFRSALRSMREGR